MKKVFSVVAVVVMFVFSANVFASEEENAEGWVPTTEISSVVYNGYIDEYSGAKTYEKTLFTQSVMVGLDKDGTGIYVQAENFSPLEKDEMEETDFYAGIYTEIYGVKFDIGYGRYWIREAGEIDFNGVYAEITFPAPFLGIVPFVKAEYRFAEKVKAEDGEEISLNGFVYYGGFQREFQIHERVSLTAEVSVGGHDGIYNMPVENLAFAREKLELKISLTDWLSLKGSALTQQNIGDKYGIATDVEKKVFVSGAIVLTF